MIKSSLTKHRSFDLLRSALYSAMLICAQMYAADDRPGPFTVNANDTAYLKAVSTLKEATDEAKRLGFPDVPRFSERPLKSVYYPTLGRAERIKSFQLPCVDATGNLKGSYWWIKVMDGRDSLYQLDFSPPERPQAKPFTSSFSRDAALAKCRSFVTLLTRGSLIHLNESNIEFVQEFNYNHEANPIVGAYWRASFQRVSRTGIAVSGDTVSVTLDEQFGLRHFQNACLAELALPPDEKPSILKGTATKEAIRFAQRVKNESPAVKGYFSQYTLDQTPTATELLIARPTDILTCADINQLKRHSKAVLVWAVTFKLIDPNGKLAPGVLQIYIDAVEGSFVGGVC